jgi:protein-S-isoprenylcysteine O-methyltransferase Ste14
MIISNESSQTRPVDFIRQTLREIPDKLPFTLTALFVYYWLPLLILGLKELLFSSILAPPMLVCTIVFLTQPTPTSTQVKGSEDHSSMKFLIMATITSQIAVMIDWGMNGYRVFEWNVYTVTGLLLMLSGVIIRVWAIVELGRYFDNSVRILADHRIIDTGPYRGVRHGSYSGVYLLAIGIALYFAAWWGLAVSVVVLGWAYYYRIQHEENAMLAAFGDSYREYCEKTYRIFPFIW